ncbi:hypothetical protein HUX88_03210 [Duganella sp. BJB1802]|uniref:hypothetical protein n=1 Tax=Duganella sp. BJB1802 TaxID=2744575 RepID=UPI001593ED51|nr:hypothetical protein [Duganella sp. BJB1802]NVD69565.1 hypothetical protein [Duganella sp. BJB1802]
MGQFSMQIMRQSGSVFGKSTDDGVTPLASGVISKGCWQVAVPRQEIINPVNGMIGEMRQHVTQ